MKTQLLYKAVYVLFLIPTIAFSNNDLTGKYEKEKTIKKEYTVNNNALLKIDNSYGNLDIVTYNGNKIIIEVTIKVSGNDQEKVQKKLNDITVTFNASESLVDAKTIFNNDKKSWWNWGSDNNNINMEINYLVKLPITNSVDLNNDYGSINLDKLGGKATIHCDYGKITTKELMAENNVLSFDYTSSCYFEFINTGKINADYSGFTVAKTKKLDITADYTKSIIEIAENVNFNCDYGSININKLNNVTGNGDYLTMRFGEVYKNIDIKGDYGSIKIDKMTANAGTINIDSNYLGITIGYHPEYHFNFDIITRYGAIRNTEDFEFSKKNTESSTNYYQGHYGSSGSSNLIKIKSDYGSVTFKKN